jgi:hypothetical protein
MNATAAGLIQRAADRLEGTALDLIRGVAIDETTALEHNIASKAAVDPTDSPLSGRRGYWDLFDAFQARAVLDRIGGAEVPFATDASVMVTPPPAAWVTAHGAKPVGKAAIARVNLAPLKVASLLVLSRETVRGSGGRADQALRTSIAAAASRAVNTTLLGAAAAVADESPAGLAAGLSVTPSTGLSDAQVFDDVLGLVDGFDRPTLVASLGPALRIRAALRGADELPVIIAPEAGSLVFAVDEFAVAFALGAIDVAASEHATLAMSDEPGSPAQQVSMYQTNSVALRVDVHANWTVARPGGVRVLDLEAS